MVNMVIFRLDKAQDSRQLSLGEVWLRCKLKLAILGLSSDDYELVNPKRKVMM